MPWFCHTTSKKRSNKTRVGGVGRKSGRKEIERRATFVVIVKNFTASLRDEVSVHRGQVVEVVCTKGSWVYIRDMNSSVGYVPKDHTLDIERIEGNFTNANVSIDGDRGDQNITGPASHPRLINVSTLQRSGSSVNSVEVHHVNSVAVTEVRDPGEGQATPTTTSSQAIYEVPRCPDGAAAGTTISEEVENVAPALPPRSSCLPSPAEVQRICPHSHGHSSRHHHRPLQRHRPGNLTLSSSANSNRTPFPCRPPRSGYTYGPFSPTSSSCTPSTYSSNHSSVAYTPLGSNRPLPFTQTPGSSSSAPGNPSCTPGCSPPAWTPGAIRTINGASPHGQRQSISRPFSANTPASAHTPGSAGLPLASAASPVSAHFAPTPGASNGSSEASSCNRVSHGFMVPSSSPSSHSPYGLRARARAQRSRRYSSDLQVHSTISENISSEALGNYGMSPLGVPRQQSRRQSQPCLVMNPASTPGIWGGNKPHLPLEQPSHLPVRRSFSMHEPLLCKHAPTGQSSCPSTPLQKQPIPIHRALSYQEAVLTEDEKVFGVAASIKPSEIIGNSFTSSPCRPFNSSPSASGSQWLGCGSGQIDNIGASEEAVEVSMSTPDDVFLPDVKKPVGIYRCLRMHKPKFKGEIVLKENEMVIVLDYGKGEWAWIVTSDNVEGLVPKSVLVKYHSNGNGIRHSDSAISKRSAADDNDSGRGTITKRNGTESILRSGNGNFRVDATTQTDPHIPFRSSSRSGSVGLSTGYNTSSAPTNENSPLSTSLRAERGERQTGRKKEVKDENIILLEAAATAVVEHMEVRTKPRPHPPMEWFNTIDSLDERERIKPCAESDVVGSRTCSTSRQVDSCSPSLLETVVAPESSQTSNLEKSDSTLTTCIAASAERTEVAATATRTVAATASRTTEVAATAARTTEVSATAARTTEVPGTTARTIEVAATAARTTEVAATEMKVAKTPAKTTKIAATKTRAVEATATKTTEVAAATGGTTRTEVVKPGTTHYHDRISGLGSVSFNDKTPSSSSPRPMKQLTRQLGLSNVLTAIKDYSPPSTAKNCLPIKEGDVLHLQTHMHYPKGWMWVWHTSKRGFGYVPKSYVAYTYDTVKRERPSINTEEDAV